MRSVCPLPVWLAFCELHGPDGVFCVPYDAPSTTSCGSLRYAQLRVAERGRGRTQRNANRQHAPIVLCADLPQFLTAQTNSDTPGCVSMRQRPHARQYGECRIRRCNIHILCPLTICFVNSIFSGKCNVDYKLAYLADPSTTVDRSSTWSQSDRLVINPFLAAAWYTVVYERVSVLLL